MPITAKDRDEYEWMLHIEENIDNKYMMTFIHDAYSDLMDCTFRSKNEHNFMTAYERIFIDEEDDL